ncbi:YkvA family protein [Frankia sp. R82]|uniref:YkvA family protein n=1 Tax=Frankia sp. R82 TaxID=2950553 RepID=UPI002043C1A6|nr:DUF1232 domain-containing protein [Frankia sp. R82]MCM3886558.1 DUF1232 domain-containing protein [Frankia sp. R82]
MGDFGTALLIGLGVLVAVGLVLAIAALVVIRRYDLPVRGIVATLGSLAYVVSPVDAVPEIPLGPIGLIDDLLVIIGAVVYVHGLIQSRRGDGHTPGLSGGLPRQPAPPRLTRGQRGRR